MNRISGAQRPLVKSVPLPTTGKMSAQANAAADALEQLKMGKPLFMRHKDGEAYLTTKTPKWYQSLTKSRNAKAEKSEAQSFLNGLLNPKLGLHTSSSMNSVIKAAAELRKGNNSESLVEGLRTMSRALAATNKR